MAAPRKGRLGIPVGEIAFVVVLAALALGFIAWRIAPLLEQAEKTAMEVQMLNLRSALRLEIARCLLEGRRPAELLQRDPLSMLDVATQQGQSAKMPYLAKIVSSGRWSFDAASRKLVYHPVRYRYLSAPDGEPLTELSWQLGGGDGEPVLRLLTPYRWF